MKNKPTTLEIEEKIEDKEKVVVSCKYQPSGGKTWIAKIVGKHPKYNYDREFENTILRERSSSGKTGRNKYSLKPGIYEVNASWDGREFLKISKELEVELLKAEDIEKAMGDE